MSGSGLAERFARLLDEVDLVTFDVFDTALVRGLLRPEDLFVQLALAGLAEGLLSAAPRAGEEFAKARRDAERAAREAAWREHARGEIRLEEIYARLASRLDLDAGVLDRLMRLEIELELAQSARNPFVGRLHDLARHAGKQTGFLSDMYLGEAQIRLLLQRGGYREFAFVYVSSCSYDSKARGTLYQRILRDTGFAPGRWLHVGDNPQSDVRMPLAAGLRALHYPKCAEQLQADPLAARRHLAAANGRGAELESRLFRSSSAGLVARRAFCDPDRAGSGAAADPWTEWGYRHVGPLLAGFATWLVRALRRRGASRAYFLARDGYLIQRAVDRLLASGCAASDAIATQYLYASRRAFNFASITRIDDTSLDFLTGGTSRLTPRQFLARIDIDIDRHSAEIEQAGLLAADEPVKGAHGRRRLRDLFRLLETRIVDQAQAEFAALGQYLREQGLLDQTEVVLVDLGWHGSLQHALEQLIRRMGSSAGTAGYYLGTFAPARRHAEQGMLINGYLCESGLPARMERSIKLSVEIIEWMFCAPHGSVRRFVVTPDGARPELAEFAFEAAQRERAAAVQRGALEFVDDYLGGWRGRELPEVPPQEAIGPLSRALARPSIDEATALGDMLHAEGFGHVAIERYIARPTGSLRDPLSYARLLHGYRESFWRAGYARRMIATARPG